MHTGAPLFGTPATGRPVKWTGTAIVRVEEGRIREIWDNVDLFAIHTQLGTISPPGPIPAES